MIHANDQGDPNANGRNGDTSPQGEPMGSPLLESPHGSDALWPEIGPTGFVSHDADCCLNEDGRCRATDQVATMDRVETTKKVQKAMSEDILDKARKICEARGEHYGDPSVDFTKIAHLWDTVFDGDYAITKEQVALAMILLKVARITQNPGYYHADSVLDIIGYAFCLEKVATDSGHHHTNSSEEEDEEDMFT